MSTPSRKLAIVGGGPSGMITLKFALEQLPNWEIVCFDKQNGFYGSWGQTHPKFVSTSTKYATQFACFKKFDCMLRVSTDAADEFFCGNEYGDYLSDFASEFGLAAHTRFKHQVHSVVRSGDGIWHVSTTNLHTDEKREESFSHVVICSGLANRLKPVACDIETLNDFSKIESISNQTVAVLGGGESAVDIAERLCQPEKKNRVYLSLRSGVRVSPRYHPIRNVPSDFLRNRLMLSIHENIRNSVGQAFVKFRIRFDRFLGRLFPSRLEQDSSPKGVRKRKAQWNLQINSRAKGKLFNMFHNKSDDFLTSIAENRLSVVGPPSSPDHKQFFDFEQKTRVDVLPDLLVNAIGFDSKLSELTDGAVRISDLFLGCIHSSIDTIYCVGYARPIIGNIPTVAEMQARYVVGVIAGKHQPPKNLEHLQKQEAEQMQQRYPSIDTTSVYPVDMYPYCDRLAKQMNCYPSRKQFESPKKWMSFWLSPATTHQYFETQKGPTPKVYTPLLITLFLLSVKLADIPYRLIRGNR